VSSPLPSRFGFARGAAAPPRSATGQWWRLDVRTWSGALAVMCLLVAGLWVIEIVNAAQGQSLDRFGLRPRRVDGLWGVLLQPFLHANYGHILSNTAPLVLLGWAVLLAGWRVWLAVTAIVVLLGDFVTWLVAPSGIIVGASGLAFGWLGYLLARAYFTRKLKWILVAVAALFFFGTFLSNLLPNFSSTISWQAHVCGFGAGIVAGAVLHYRRRAAPRPSSPAA
jgi:membrane associated rhomboid family serine protease